MRRFCLDLDGSHLPALLYKLVKIVCLNPKDWGAEVLPFLKIWSITGIVKKVTCVHICVYVYMGSGVFTWQHNSLYLPGIWQLHLSQGLWSWHRKPPVNFQSNFLLILSSRPASRALEGHFRCCWVSVVTFCSAGFAERAIFLHCLMSWNEKKKRSFKCWHLTFFSATWKKLDVWI